MKSKFDIIAKYYKILEILAFGKNLLNTRLYLLTKNKSQYKILIIGEGTGSFLKYLVNCYPKSSITIIDSSNKMNKIIEKFNQTSKNENITIFKQDYLKYISAFKYDLIYTNFFLDCFKSSDVLKIVTKIKLMLNESGEWNDVEFTKSQKSNFLNHNYNKLILNILYKFFRFICKIESSSIEDVDFNYQNLGFVLECEIFQPFPSVRCRKYKLSL